MPPKNKKKTNNQESGNKTLHHFFGARSVNSSKSSASKSSFRSTVPKPANTSEVIVIDDSDDEVEVVEGPHPQKFPQKRRKLAPSNHHETQQMSTVNPTAGEFPSSTIMGFKVSFGSPFLLSDPLPHAINLHTPEPGPPLYFGEPTLLHSPKPAFKNDSDSNQSSGIISPKREEIDFEEWIDGDDEGLYPSIQAEDSQDIKNEAGDTIFDDDSFDPEMVQEHGDVSVTLVIKVLCDP